MFKPNEGKYINTPLLIDCGFAHAKVYRKIHEDFKNVLITHSDNDHIGGLEDIIKNKNIENLHIPYYLPEIIKINEYFNKKLKNKIVKLTPSMLVDLNVHMIKDGDKSSCGYMEILNPPSDSSKIFKGITYENINDDSLLRNAIQKLNEFELNINVDDIFNYRSEILEYLSDNEKEAYDIDSKIFICSFFISLYFRIIEKDISNFSINLFLKKYLKMTANEISIVLKYKDNNTSYLFTGDAEISTFERIFTLHGNNSLEVDILKIPHHGSRYNINTRILNLINPRVAIISHNNYHGHPHKVVMDLLIKSSIKTYYTNDVMKSRRRTMKTLGFVESNDIEFI